jgi:hypothetical protein
METIVLIKFFAVAGLGYVLLLGTFAGAIPHSIAAAGLVVTWLVSRLGETV